MPCLMSAGPSPLLECSPLLTAGDGPGRPFLKRLTTHTGATPGGVGVAGGAVVAGGSGDAITCRRLPGTKQSHSVRTSGGCG